MGGAFSCCGNGGDDDGGGGRGGQNAGLVGGSNKDSYHSMSGRVQPQPDPVIYNIDLKNTI